MSEITTFDEGEVIALNLYLDGVFLVDGDAWVYDHVGLPVSNMYQWIQLTPAVFGLKVKHPFVLHLLIGFFLTLTLVFSVYFGVLRKSNVQFTLL